MFSCVDNCYLTKEYVENNKKTVAYELIMSDKHFRNVFYYVADAESLKELRKTLKAHFNFAFADGYLRCNGITQVPSNNLVEGAINKKIAPPDADYGTIYDLLQEGIDKKFMVVYDEFAIDGGTLDGIGATCFSNIKFSASTMSVYFNIMTDRGLVNKHVICMEEFVLKLKPFYFAVPVGEKPAVFDRKAIEIEPAGFLTINNCSYNLYYVKNISIYDFSTYACGEMINKASVVVAKAKNAINILDDYRRIICKALNRNTYDDDAKIPWAGGSGSHKSAFGVFYKATLENLSQRERSIVINIVLNDIVAKYKGHTSIQEMISELWKPPLSYAEKMAGGALLNVVSRASTLEESVLLTGKAIEQHRLNYVFSNLYLYKIRSRVYLKKDGFATPFNCMLVGSDEPISTIAKEVFYDNDII